MSLRKYFFGILPVHCMRCSNSPNLRTPNIRHFVQTATALQSPLLSCLYLLPSSSLHSIYAPSQTQIRHKFDKRSRKKSDNDEDDDSVDDIVADFADMEGGKDNKVTKVKVTSLRTDLLIKSGLGMARNKVEATFYDSKIRVNGKKIAKKSSPIKTGDEIDVIKEFSPVNPANIVVSRIEVLSVVPNTEDITVVMRRYKSLTIENYEAENVWRQHNADQ